MRNGSICFMVMLVALCSTTSLSLDTTDTVRYHFPIVTTIGTRYAEPWIVVPLSLTYLQAKDMPRGKGYGLDEVLSAVPGVLVQSRFGNQDVRISIRGFGARGAGERSNAGTSRGVRILSNGFPDTEPDGRTSFDLADIAGAGAIEVLRSNASSIYGNASGGVVNIISNTMFDAPYAAYTQSFGSFGFRKEAVNVGTTLGTGRMYLSMSNTNNDGWRYQSRSSQALLTTGIVSQVGERTQLGVHLAATSNIFRIPGPLSQRQYDSLAQQSDSLYIKRDERRFNKVGRIGITLTHDIDAHNTVSTSAFVQPKIIQRSERGTFRDFNRYHLGGSALFRNTASFGPGVENTVLAGVDEAYQDGSILFYTLTAQSGRGTLSDNKREGANNFGAFLQNEVELNDNVLVLLGARYDDITYYSEGYFAAPSARKSETKSFSRVTPKAGVTYRATPTLSVYANVGGGIEVPAGNETDPSGTVPGDSVFSINPLLEPIRSTTVEAGMKHIVTLGEEDGTLTYSIAAYRLRVTNDIIPYRNGRFYFTAGVSQRQGIEAAGELRLAMGLSVNAALTLSDNTYKEYRIDSVHYSAAKAGKFADYAGNTMVGIPGVFWTVGMKYSPPMVKGAYVRCMMQSVGSYYANDANTVLVPSYTVVNAGAGVEHLALPASRLYVSAYAGVNNMMNAKYVGSAWLNPDLIGGRPVFIEPGLPSNFIGSIGLGVDL